jgi:hypothetical protein
VPASPPVWDFDPLEGLKFLSLAHKKLKPEMPVQKFNNGARVKMKNSSDVWVIMDHDTIKKGATTKVTGKIKCRNEKTGEVKFFSQNGCEPA